ncbi:MAG: preprotein translocase subunit YajC [Gemmatimonadota bacterium]
MIASILMAGPQGANAGGTLFMFASFIAILYFLLIRPQRKQQKEHEALVRGLKKGDRVVTLGGIIGKVVHVQDERIIVKTGGDTRIEIERSKVSRVLGGDS